VKSNPAEFITSSFICQDTLIRK